MRKRIAWYEETLWLHQGLRGGGAFLVAEDDRGKPNPMTIGWGQVGIVWSIPVFTAFVRESRYTHECVRASHAFTVSVPRPGELAEALALCGSSSGRDTDKAARAGLTMVPASDVGGSVIAECGLHYECEILTRTQQHREDFADPDVLKSYYPGGDHHLAVFGRIVAAFAEL